MADEALAAQVKKLPRRALVEALLLELEFSVVDAAAGTVRFGDQQHTMAPGEASWLDTLWQRSVRWARDESCTLEGQSAVRVLLEADAESLLRFKELREVYRRGAAGAADVPKCEQGSVIAAGQLALASIHAIAAHAQEVAFDAARWAEAAMKSARLVRSPSVPAFFSTPRADQWALHAVVEAVSRGRKVTVDVPSVLPPIVASVPIAAGVRTGAVELNISNSFPEVAKAFQERGWIDRRITRVALRWTRDAWKTVNAVDSDTSPECFIGPWVCLRARPGAAVEFAIQVTLNGRLTEGGSVQMSEFWLNNGGTNFKQVVVGVVRAGQAVSVKDVLVDRPAAWRES